MSTRYDDRDDRDYDRDSQYYGQYNRRSSLDNTRSFGDRADNRWGNYSGGSAGSGSRGYGGSVSNDDWRESERYGREDRGYSSSSGYGRGEGGRSRYDRGEYGRSSDYGRSDYGQRGYSSGASSSGRYTSGRDRGSEGGREDYWGRGWENERDDDTRESRYGSYGRSGAERGYSEGMTGGYSQRYNYPTGFRSRESYGESGGRSDYDRDRYDRAEGRGWWDRASDEVASWFGDEEAERRRRMDAQREHRGRGPKNYRRSDERIKEDVNDRLSDDYFLDASDIEVMVQNTEVTLTGTVNNRSDKRRAEDIAEAVSGVTNVENRLRVKQRGYGDYSTGSSTMSATGAGSTTASGTGSTTGTGTGSDIAGTPGTTTSSAAAGGSKNRT
jgi:osmotically-inducible protein OsmY